MRWKFIFHPCKPNPFYLDQWQKYALSLKNVSGWFSPSASSDSPVIIYFGGNAENVAHHLNERAQFKDISFLFVNYPAYNYAQGKPTQKSVFATAISAYDQLVDAYKIPPSKIFLMGRSLGCAVAAYLATQRKAQGIILITPYDQIKNIISGFWLFRPVIWVINHHFNTSQYLRDYTGHVLILAAEKDEMIPRSSTQHLIKLFKKPINSKEIKSADHQNITEFDDYYEAINQFIQEKTSPNPE
jgi:uncharacterized protein